jgi:1,4-dihydroxy-2-naphthoyl-CoA hydrolase|tara:strand:+ start:3563 stop:3988 length:426 start_codon:yes stop_codon:yes gene_type:complete
MWKNKYTIEECNKMCENTIHDALGIKLTEVGADFLKGTMPVDDRTVQPFRLLHGGASVVLAESLGSLASVMMIDQDRNICVGLDVNANHVRAAKSGIVTGVAKPINIGGKIHIWEIKITNEADKLVCIVRLTVTVLPKGKI